MGTVTGMTAEAITELTNGSIVNGEFDEASGLLTLLTRDGEARVLGSVPTKTSILDSVYPIGSLFFSAIATNPATQLGIGTWAAFSVGRVLVGVDPAQPEFDTAEETGGEKTHALTAAEMPAHTHTGPAHTHAIDHDHAPATTSSNGTHDHGAQTNDVTGHDTGNYMQAASAGKVEDNGALIENAGAHTHTLDLPEFTGTSGSSGTANTGSAGSGSAHNNLQPYITVFIWKRTG